jgi:cyclophilin family peptidyl-prolyl cis-trans isomerase/HEAT repeat protein
MRRSALAALACGAALNAGAQGIDSARYARLLQMADERRVDSALVLDMLANGTTPERAAAARAVGQVHGAALAPRLRSLLGDRDSAVAANAAFALGLLKDSASVGALARALASAPAVAAQAAWSLGTIGAPAARVIDSALAARPPRPAAVTATLLIAASRLRPVPVARVIPYFASDSGAIRWAAAYAIARPYAAAGVRAVMPLARDPDAGVRSLVARALAKNGAGDSLAALALPLLDTLARDANAQVRVNAVRALGTYGPRARDAVMAALHDADANVRFTAAQALGTVLEGAKRKLWIDAWNADTTFVYRREVLIRALGDEVVLDAADEDNPDGWRHNGDWRHRAAVADAGSASKNIQRMRDISLPLARDRDPRVRAAAYSAMAPWADSAGTHVWRREFMYLALTDWDPVVRTIAIGSLESHGTAAEAVLVLKGYPRSAADSDNDARVTTVAFLISAWGRDSAHFSKVLRTQISALPVPPDQQSRDAAKGFALLAAWSAAPAPPARPLAWYQDIVHALVIPGLAGHAPRAEIVTRRGPLTVEFAPLDAPLTVHNFLSLARAGYYDSTSWHRVVPNFVVQDGDRRGTGSGGPGYSIRDEFNRLRYDRGALGMALSGPDTGGSQYFFTLSPQPHLDAGYTTFGRIIAGWDALDAIVQGDAITSVRIAE